MATMKDVARLAGVSHGTVSNIINGAKGVRLDKVKRVQKAMKELSYEPNAIARNLKMNKTMQIDVILPNIMEGSLSQIYTSLSVFAAEKGYTANLHMSNEDAELETVLLNQALMFHKDGVLLISCQPQNTELFKQLALKGLKIVFLQRQVSGFEHCFFGMDFFTIIKNVTSQLIDENLQEIAMINGPLEYSNEQEALNGYIQAYQEKGKKAAERATAGYDRESALKEAIRLLQKSPQVMIATSTQVMQAVQKAMELTGDKHKPLLVALVPASWTVTYQEGIVFVQMPFTKMAEKAFECLLKKIENVSQENACEEYIKAEICSIKDVFKKQVTHFDTTRPKKRIRILLTEDKAKYAIETLVSAFERQMDCVVEVTAYPYAKMYAAIKAEWYQQHYDVFDLDIPWVEELAQKNVVEKLDPYFKNDAAILADIPQNILEKFCVFDGAVYGIPFTFCTQLLFYRKDFFADIKNQRIFYECYKRELKIPQTWEEYNVIAKFFTKKYNPYSPTDYGTTLGSCVSSGATCEFLPRFWAFGAELFDDSGFTINSKQAVLALENYQESFLYAAKSAPEQWWSEQAQEFRDGNAAMMMTFADNITAVTERSKSKIIGKIGYNLISGGVSVDGGWVLAMNAHSKNKKEAFEFMKWSCCKEISVISTILGGFVPSKTAIENLEIANIYPWLRKTMEGLKNGKPRRLPRKADGLCFCEADFENVFGKAVYEVVTGEKNAKEALDAANQELNDLLHHYDRGI
ncbi:MAG: extracellular solute-binding protein [Christensenellaceae bacterium]